MFRPLARCGTTPIMGLGAALVVSSCATLTLPSYLTGQPAGETSGDALLVSTTSDSIASQTVKGESGIAAGIPAAVEVFGDPGPGLAPSIAVADPDALPTLLPRHRPATDRFGRSLSTRVSLAPDGRRLAVATQERGRVRLQVLAVNRKDIEREETHRGTFDFVGWADARTILLGTRQDGVNRIEALDVSTGLTRTVSAGPGPHGVLMVDDQNRIVTVAPGRTAFTCANGTKVPTTRGDTRLLQAGPLNADGHIVLRSDEGEDEGLLIPFDCGTATFGPPIYEGGPFVGALFSGAGKTYYGVWEDDGVRYFDPSLTYEMDKIASSFGEEVDVWPIEFASSPNTVLLHVSGPAVTPGYYVLDRYAGALDLHVGG